jgi:hypothetical protein
MQLVCGSSFETRVQFHQGMAVVQTGHRARPFALRVVGAQSIGLTGAGVLENYHSSLRKYVS